MRDGLEFLTREELRKAYRALEECVFMALGNDNLEIAVICAVPLAKLAEIEAGSYLADAEDYNNALPLSERVLEEAEEASLPSWLKRRVRELRQILEETGWT